MPQDSSDRAHSVAVEQLRAFGLSTYAAQTYVALVQLGRGTAKDVSGLSDVPRTRVYEAVEELQDRGLVDVQESTPKQFRPVSVETTGRHFDREFTHRVDRLTESLDTLDRTTSPAEQRGVWTVTGCDTVTERLLEFVETATDEVVFMTVEELLTEELVEHLRAASERGVSIKLAGMSDGVEADLRDEIPGTEFFESLWAWSDTPAGRLLMVDQEKTLVSVLVPEAESAPAAQREETAIWGTGDSNSLVVILKVMFTWQLDGPHD